MRNSYLEATRTDLLISGASPIKVKLWDTMLATRSECLHYSCWKARRCWWAVLMMPPSGLGTSKQGSQYPCTKHRGLSTRSEWTLRPTSSKQWWTEISSTKSTLTETQFWSASSSRNIRLHRFSTGTSCYCLEIFRTKCCFTTSRTSTPKMRMYLCLDVEIAAQEGHRGHQRVDSHHRVQ